MCLHPPEERKEEDHRGRTDAIEVILARKRLLTQYVSYDHRFRTPAALDMDWPEPRSVAPPEAGAVRTGSEVGGLPHHYARRAA
jgi:hypothetical protein